ncbi:unnamed protein product [Cuscuta epithymum]|uniref:Uncharacterized protein n=1 Tax=Cuscuta epithymum TaxID=186058 RepID=A0AAV0DG28_9ASTE|nr:unnamed protein product [Cuscuta epithymum]
MYNRLSGNRHNSERRRMNPAAGREKAKVWRRKVDRPEKTLFLLSTNHLFVIENIENGIESNCSVTELPNRSMGMLELESKIFLVGGENKNQFGWNTHFDDAFPREICEVKQHSDSVSIVPSTIMPKMNEGKLHAIVQKFGSKIFVLHRGPILKLDELTRRYSTSVFECFDSAFPENGWVVKSGIPFYEGVYPQGRYVVHGFFLIGEKLYLNVSWKGYRYYVFDFKTEEWSKDDCFFVGNHSCPGRPKRAVSAPGLDDDTYIIFGFHNVYFPEVRATLFTQGKGCSCYQDVDGNRIFNLQGLGGDTMGCDFVEIGNGDYFGLLTAREFKTGDYYLLVSTFSVKVLAARVPPIESLDKPIKMTFLSIKCKNQQKFNITGVDFCYFAGAACL